MPAPYVTQKDKNTGLILDIRKVVQGTAGWEGEDCYQFCMGEGNGIGENNRTWRVKVSSRVADEIALFLTK